MCNDCDKTPTCFETKKCEPCKAPISTSCLYYNLENQENSHLLAIGIENGSPLNTVLETLTKKVNLVATPNFTSFTIPYLKGKYTTTNIKQFSEGVSLELGNLNSKTISNEACCTENREAIAQTTLEVNAIKFPKIQDTSIAGFTVNSTINVVLQKLSNQIATLNGAQVVSPPITANETSSIKINKSGTLGHTISAIVKRSNAINNQLMLNSDGLYVAPYTAPNQTQTLYGEGNIVKLTSGGQYTVPIPSLVLNGTNLTIAGSTSTVNLGSILSTSPFTLSSNNTSSITTTISGTTTKLIQSSVVVSRASGNALISTPTGLFVSSNGAQAVLKEIDESASNSPLRSTFCSIQNTSCKPPYRFYVKNTSVTPIQFTYLHRDTGSQTEFLIPGQAIILYNVERITYDVNLLGNVDIKFLGI